MSGIRFTLLSLPRVAVALAALALPAMAAAATSDYRYDTVHSQVVFSIDHNGYSRPFGRLHIARGWLRFDPDDWSTAATDLDIDLAGVDMGDAEWNAAVRKPSLLDADKQRYAHFVSRSVERRDDTHGVLHGDLTLRGITRPVELPFTLNRHASTIYGLHEVIGFSATATLDRTAFGITAFSNSIGHNASLWLELEAIRADSAHDPQAGTPTKEQP